MVLSDFFSNFAPKFIRVLILDEKSYCICGLYPRGGLSVGHCSPGFSALCRLNYGENPSGTISRRCGISAIVIIVFSKLISRVKY